MEHTNALKPRTFEGMTGLKIGEVVSISGYPGRYVVASFEGLTAQFKRLTGEPEDPPAVTG